MKHLAVIQSEFLKEARKWDDLSYEDQKGYLKRHPASKRKLTAKPDSSTKGKDDDKLVSGLSWRKNKHKKEKLHKEIEQKKETLTQSETPKLDQKLGDLFDAYSKTGINTKMEDDSKDGKKLLAIWNKEFPDEQKISPLDVINDIHLNTGLVARHGRKPTRNNPLSKEEFVQAAKDVYLANSDRLPKVEGEEDPSSKDLQTYGLNNPLTSTEKSKLKEIEASLPDDQKQFAKYLVPDSRRDDEKRSLEDTSGERPIIKEEYTHPNFGETTRYLIPTATRFSVPRKGFFTTGAGGLEFGSFESIDDAKDFITKAPELERKAILRNEIEKIGRDIEREYSAATRDMSSSSTLDSIASTLANYPREDQYGVRYDNRGDVADKFVSQKGRKFNLTEDEQKNVARALSYPKNLSSDKLEKAINDLDAFTKDVESNKDLLPEYQKRDVDSFSKDKDKYKTALKTAVPKVKLISKLMDQHGYEKSKADLKLPEGFKFKDKSTIGEQWGDITVGSDDGNMEIGLSLGKPGEYGKYDGEVFYKVPGQSGHYSIGRRGIDSGLTVNWNDDRSFADVVKDVAAQVKEKQDKIGRSVDVPVAGGTWKVTPKRVEEMKNELKSGKSLTFAPHGMGTGYHVSTKPSRHSKPASQVTNDFFGLPLYIESYDHD
ncbi:MAG: hypothetical protein Q7R33_09560 [Nitrosarchaeum sp.]|nr:hypothetical protein [Nitrosarchaeum sp.]